MIRWAQAGDHPQLKALWMQVFGDDAKTVEGYFALRHRDENMLVWAERGEIGGMLSMLPLTLRLNEKTYPGRYIYAVATAPVMRRRGIASALLERAGERIAARSEAAAVLAPASDSLFSYYAKRGYQTAFSSNVADFEAAALPVCSDRGMYAPCSAADYARIRDRAYAHYAHSLYAQWDVPALHYALSALGDGGAGRFALDKGEGVAAWSRTERGILVRELALVGMDIPSALALLHRASGASAYRVRLAAGALADARVTPFGMIRWFIPKPHHDTSGYLSLALD